LKIPAAISVLGVGIAAPLVQNDSAVEEEDDGVVVAVCVLDHIGRRKRIVVNNRTITAKIGFNIEYCKCVFLSF
jgi:hypothetical protein